MSAAVSPLNRTLLALAALGAATPAAAGSISSFTQGDLVIETVTNSTGLSNASALDTASPMTLQEFSLGSGGTSATSVGTFTLPQTASGANWAISGEYGSASEGFLQLSGNGHLLTIMGYGVNAATFNSAPLSTYGTAALGQTTSVSGGSYTVVPRVVAAIGANGSVDTSTAVLNFANTNNPRSVYTVDGSSFYVSGQGGSKTDPTQGVQLVNRGASTGTTINNQTDVRFVTGYNNTLYASRDYNPSGSGAQNYTGVVQLGSTSVLPTSAVTTPTHIVPAASPLSLGGNNGSINLTAATANGVNNSRIGSFVYLSPEEYFFASPTVLYVADSGQPKNGNANKAALGEGGLQKWVLDTSTGVWSLEYDLYQGLNLVNNNNVNLAGNTVTTAGVTGLFGLTGKVVGNQVELFATSYGLNELSPSYLYEITDTLDATTGAGEAFTTLFSAPTNVSIRGVSFAPAPGPVLGQGLLSLGGLVAAGARTLLARRRRRD
ncbi:hypothetical protein [Methylocystis bryophila]|uniref:Uncharacterized protein n=1 Tax=Methylocystis bryophila TaxID=655015 RepID=A0A1W6MVJ2_9HYPH|nr:hypothetical protein [Methylocystis bryophila]ARN81621.1 hypothetical protein B1812_11670 [Methylocystis bryophila]BDV37662.1 hypothetical protein DSM21852_09150 [Methylocystis bryophila]